VWRPALTRLGRSGRALGHLPSGAAGAAGHYAARQFEVNVAHLSKIRRIIHPQRHGCDGDAHLAAARPTDNLQSLTCATSINSPFNARIAAGIARVAHSRGAASTEFGFSGLPVGKRVQSKPHSRDRRRVQLSVRLQCRVGTAITGRPPHRSGRAQLRHPALTGGIWRPAAYRCGFPHAAQRL
jgi:hypothetical protein